MAGLRFTPMTAESETQQNTLAFVLVLLSKVFGIVGLIVGAFHRVAGGTLLLLDGLFIIASVVLCVRLGKKQAKAAEDDRKVVARLVREGTLKQYLRDVEAEARAAEGRGTSTSETRASSSPSSVTSALALD